MILLDTNIVIYFLNGNKKIAEKLDEYSPDEIHISFVTLGELLFGAYHSKKKDHNRLKVIEFAETIQVLHSTPEIARWYGELKNKAIRVGCFPGDHDIWIAATAQQKKLSLMTNNEKHFQWIPGLSIGNWM